jgi:hypothetical protein
MSNTGGAESAQAIGSGPLETRAPCCTLPSTRPTERARGRSAYPPDDAIRCFLTTGIDALLMGDRLLIKDVAEAPH